MKTYVLSRPKFDWREFNQFCDDEHIDINTALTGKDYNAAESLVETAGRLCYMSYGRGRTDRTEFIKNLIDSGHHSVLEHANWSLLITGVSRSLTHEFIRHRHFSYSQLSQRFCDQSKETPICPVAIREHAGLEALWNKAMRAAFEAYRDLDAALSTDMTRKEHRTAARSVLPNATPTKIVVTGNTRAWREFLVKRLVPAADPEIRQLAEHIRAVLIEESLAMFGDLVNAPVSTVS